MIDIRSTARLYSVVQALVTAVLCRRQLVEAWARVSWFIGQEDTVGEGLSLTAPVSALHHLLGKKANPPRYWQTTVFPTALAFIASALGGVKPGGQDELSPTQATQGNDKSFSTCKTVHTGEPVVSVTAAEILAGPAVEEGTQPNAERAVHPGGSLPSLIGGVGETTMVEARRPVRPSVERGSSSEYAARQANVASSTPASLPQQRQQKPGEYLAGTAGAPAGKCLVVCPTGAEASIIVCISALVAFFPPPHVPACSSTASAKSGRQQLLSTPPPQTSAAVETHETERGEVEPYLGGGKFSVLRPREMVATASMVTKAQLRTRFLLVQQECPWARPPRRLMQQLNEYFMTPGEHSWWTLSYLIVQESDSPVDDAT